MRRIAVNVTKLASGINRPGSPDYKSDVSAPHNVMPTSNTAQSKGVNPNSLPSFMTWAIVRCSLLVPAD